MRTLKTFLYAWGLLSLTLSLLLQVAALWCLYKYLYSPGETLIIGHMVPYIEPTPEALDPVTWVPPAKAKTVKKALKPIKLKAP